MNVRKGSTTEKGENDKMKNFYRRSINEFVVFLAPRPSSLPIGPKIGDDSTKEIDFFTKQARLQIEARMALAQAKDMAHMQMEVWYWW